MIKSMTGFGRGETITQEAKIIVEIKAVNHRYCELNLKIPRKLNSLETVVRNYIKKTVQRGKLDVYISYEDLSDRDCLINCNLDMGKGYYQAIETLANTLGLPNRATAYEISRFPEVISLEDSKPDTDGIKEQLLNTLDMALERFSLSREEEGEHLKEDILAKLEGMLTNVAAVEKRYPQMISDYRVKLENKVKELLEEVNIDEARLATEVVIYADKICVDEETVRLRSHIAAMKGELTAGGSVGRKLDFIAQEMNREANTILSKVNDITISNTAIELKTDIEKIREQVQNIE